MHIVFGRPILGGIGYNVPILFGWQIFSYRGLFVFCLPGWQLLCVGGSVGRDRGMRRGPVRSGLVNNMPDMCGGQISSERRGFGVHSMHGGQFLRVSWSNGLVGDLYSGPVRGCIFDCVRGLCDRDILDHGIFCLHKLRSGFDLTEWFDELRQLHLGNVCCRVDVRVLPTGPILGNGVHIVHSVPRRCF